MLHFDCLTSMNRSESDLGKAIARLTQTLCTTEMAEESRKTSLEAYLSNRLIPLEKAPSGVRPIGIG